MTRVAINGFGRIGRLVTRVMMEDPEVDLVVTVGNMLGEWGSNNWDGNGLMTDILDFIKLSAGTSFVIPAEPLKVRARRLVPPS